MDTSESAHNLYYNTSDLSKADHHFCYLCKADIYSVTLLSSVFPTEVWYRNRKQTYEECFLWPLIGSKVRASVVFHHKY